jgi:hypothetical protein
VLLHCRVEEFAAGHPYRYDGFWDETASNATDPGLVTAVKSMVGGDAIGKCSFERRFLLML